MSNENDLPLAKAERRTCGTCGQTLKRSEYSRRCVDCWETDEDETEDRHEKS